MTKPKSSLIGAVIFLIGEVLSVIASHAKRFSLIMKIHVLYTIAKSVAFRQIFSNLDHLSN